MNKSKLIRSASSSLDTFPKTNSQTLRQTATSKLMKKLLVSAALVVLCAQNATASIFFDVNSTTAGTGITSGGSFTWEGNFWTTTSGGTTATTAYDTLAPTDGTFFPRFTSSVTGGYTVTANANHSIAGMLMSTTTGTLTIQGTGVLSINAGLQGFFGGSGFMSISSKLTGPGGVVGSSGQIFLNGVNDYAGGTTPGSGLINFNSGSSFGTGHFVMTSSGGALIVEGTSAITITNDWDLSLATTTINCVGNPAGVTYSGVIPLGANTFNIGSGGATANINTFSGLISGTGNLGRSAGQSPAGIIVLTGANTYTGKTSLQSGNTSVSSINSVTTPAQQTTSCLGKPSSAANGILAFGGTTVPGILTYTGTGETTDRVIDLAGTSGGATIDQSGTGLLKFTSANTASGIGSKTLTLQGATAGTGEFAGIISDNTTVGSTVTTFSFPINSVNITNASVDGMTVGAAIAGTGIAGGATITAINTATKVVTITPAATSAGTLGETITVAGTKNLTSVLKTGSGKWTLSGVNTYSGTTTLNTAGQLNLANSSSLGTSAFVIAQNGLFDNVSGGDLTIANSIALSGGSPTYVGSANNMTITGPASIAGATRTITVTAKTLTLTQGITQDSARAFTKAGNGTLVLSGACAYTGATTINGGTLRVDGSTSSSSAVTVAAAGTLGGNGTVAGTVTVNGTISPGASPGTLTTGAETWAGAGNYVWEINDFNGSIGSAYDTINATSANITATTGSKFNIKVTSLNGTSAGTAVNFNGNTDYDFTILHTTGGITGNGVAALNVDTSAFQNTLGNGGFFFLTISGNDLVLSYRRAAFIASNPGSLALAAGATANFSGSATGSGSVTYQWKKGGVNLSNGSQPGNSVVSGATTAALTVLGVTYQDEGAYTLVATGTYGAAATSSAAALTVTDPPVITSPTSDSTVVKDAGQNQVLTVTQTGRVGTYQWKKGAGNLSNGAFDNAATVSGATAATLTLASVRGADAGIYSVVITTTDGNATSANTTLQVNDPAIAIQPASSTFECGSSNALTVTAFGTTNANGLLTYQWYTPDPSGTAITDATNSVLSFPTVSFANAGSYSVVVSNALGNFITSSVVVVTIEDTNAPVISVIGGAATAECHTSYSDAGATATDSCDGSVSVSTAGLPNINATGDYTVTYTATDSHANSSTATRLVHIQDTTVPTLTLLGSAELTISCGTPYSDAGATASDSCAGTITGSIIVNYGGLVPAAPIGGDYTITYNVQDPSGNAAIAVTRLVHVVDSTPPVITVQGASPVTVECHSSYTDAGATANDNCAGVVTPTTSGSVDANTVGNYTLTYSATDGVNISTATRVVHVTDTTAPVITLNGGAAVTNECHTSYSDPSASASDDCDAGALVSTSGTVDLNTVGVYTRTYTATDASGNHSSTTRQITVSDTVAPVITVTAGVSTVECHTSYTDAGATAADACDAAPSVGTTGSVDANTTGNYTITYTAQDASGNSSTATRVVTVVDGTAPVVTLNGAASVTLECHGSFSDPGASASDTCDASVTVSTSGVLDANTPGVYTLTYSSTDLASNTGTATRTVTVSDNAAPVVTLTGAASVTVECHSSYTEAGATANDACEGSVSVNTTGSVDANTVGNYTLTYGACDSGSHCAATTRIVHVIDTAAPLVTINGTSPMTVECHGSFSDPGATSADDCDAGPSVVTSGSVNANAVGFYTLTYSSTDAANNTGSATRVVHVTDTVAPVITVTGGDQTVECHDTFTDAGATAADACEGDVSTNIAVSGSVDANTVGVYTLTYSVADGSGNPASATRIVTVNDTVPPVITVTGGTTVSACQFVAYNDAGATANDACTGSVSVSSSGSVDTSTAGAYTLTYSAQDTTGNTATAIRVVTVGPCNAVITQQPHDTNVNANASFTLSVTAVSGNPITYQWKTNGVAISGATDSSYTVAHAFRGNAGTYTVDVISGVTTITSDPAVVTVQDPAFTINPISQTLAVGVNTNLSLVAVADGTPTLRYQWYVKTALHTNKLVTTTNLTIKPLALGSAGTYFCVVSNAGHGITATSSMATIAVYQAPKVSTPANQTKFVGQNAIFKVAVSPATANNPLYGGPVHYQWVQGPPDNYTVLIDNGHYAGTTTTTMTIVNVQTGDASVAHTPTGYRCMVNNGAPTNVFSAFGAGLTVRQYTNPPVVVINPTGTGLVTSSNMNIAGTVTDKGLVTDVSLKQITVDATNTLPSDITYKTNAAHQQMPGNVLWTNAVTLTPGTNAFTATAVDGEGNTGTNKPVRNIYLLVPQALTLATNGPGTIQITSLGVLGKPLIGTTNVYQGIGYTLKALPKVGVHTFLGWTDGDNNAYYGTGPIIITNTLHFIMPGTNLTLRANFN